MNAPLLDMFVQQFLWPEVVISGLVLGWLVASYKGILLAGGVFLLSGVLIYASARLALPDVSTTNSANPNLGTWLIVSATLNTAFKTISAMIWAFVGQVAKKAIQNKRHRKSSKTREAAQ
ncbi:hypothetical protein AAFO92_04105 [Roseovarius sp. CAU 1744]|uniref:hypothetical protein n=1 Tax=Roseovarius sp. CAU 1744 TaxID=3140368 RepID=UPI00325AA836